MQTHDKPYHVANHVTYASFQWALEQCWPLRIDSNGDESNGRFLHQSTVDIKFDLRWIRVNRFKALNSRYRVATQNHLNDKYFYKVSGIIMTLLSSRSYVSETHVRYVQGGHTIVAYKVVAPRMTGPGIRLLWP